MKSIDCLGDMCPIPVLKMKKEMQKMESGEVLKLVTDHSCVLESVTHQFKKCEIRHEEVMSGVWEIYITKP